MADQITAFLMDDHEVVRQGVRALLESTGDHQGGRGGVQRRRGPRPDPCRPPRCGDPRRPGPDGNGIEVCREVRSTVGHQLPDAHVLQRRRGPVRGDHGRRRRLRAEADPWQRAARRGPARRRGESLLDPAITGKVLQRLRTPSEEDERLARLTPQERRILHYIADGMTNRQIANEMHLAEKTIKNYVSNMLTKLGMERRTEAAVFATKLEMTGHPIEG
jgi:two-component system, NarL family, response regulator DevR